MFFMQSTLFVPSGVWSVTEGSHHYAWRIVASYTENQIITRGVCSTASRLLEYRIRSIILPSGQAQNSTTEYNGHSRCTLVLLKAYEQAGIDPGHADYLAKCWALRIRS